MIEGAHHTCRGYLLGLRLVTAKVFYHLIALGDARRKVGPIVEGFVVVLEVVQCWVHILGVVVVVAVETYASHLVRRERLYAVVVVAQLLAEGIIHIRHLGLKSHFRLRWIVGIL